MFIYQIKIVIKPYKSEEFEPTMRSLSHKFIKEKGCLGYGVYRDCGKDNTYSLIGEWKSRQAMEKHFRTHDFQVLIGATRVLGETFVMNIAEVPKTGGFELARKLTAL